MEAGCAKSFVLANLGFRCSLGLEYSGFRSELEEGLSSLSEIWLLEEICGLKAGNSTAVGSIGLLAEL